MELAKLSAVLAIAFHLQCVSCLPSYILLSELPYSCSSSAPLLSSGRFAFLCIQATSYADTFFLGVSFFDPPGPPAWIANPSQPLSRNASLVLSDDFHLYLSDGSGLSGAPWSLFFPPSSPPPHALSLDTFGNLCVVDSSNAILWQSFLRPLDLLLPRQLLTPGMQLISQASGLKSQNVVYSAVMEPAGLALFANFSDFSSIPYSIFGLNPLSDRLRDVIDDQASCGGQKAVFFHDGKEVVLQRCIANVNKSRSITIGSDDRKVDFIRLDMDGSLRGYRYENASRKWIVVFDWFANSSNGGCSAPSVCGPYGICTRKSSIQSYSECSCPLLPSNLGFDSQLFSQINKSDPQQGCRLTHPFNCTFRGTSYQFIELYAVDYFANSILSTQLVENRTRHECVSECAQNCTCRAAFYRTDTGVCYLFEQVLSIIGLGNSSQVHASVYNYNEGIINATRKLSAFSQTSVHELNSFKHQSPYLSASSFGVKEFGFASSPATYLGFLKVAKNLKQTEASSPQGGGRRYIVIAVVSTVAGFIMLGATYSVLYICCRKRRSFKALGDENLLVSALPGRQNVRRFTFTQLQEASGDFKSKLGIGGFGSVYKGTLPNGNVVAIKQLESAIRCEKDFESQVVYLWSLSHPNLVGFNGLCISGSHRFLVSEYMDNGSLDAWLFHNSSRILEDKEATSVTFLDWASRFKIAVDVAKGLTFLHQSNLVHLDVKPQNILLDRNFVAKLSDYGLARLMDQEEGSFFMHMRGTPGYMAPEWVQHAYATEKSDVYSYGMVLMEILGGRKTLDLSKERENWYFPTLAAKKFKEGKLLDVLDGTLTKNTVIGEVEYEQVLRLMQVAFWCIVENPDKRPEMVSVLSMLQGLQEVPAPPLPLHFDGHPVHKSWCTYDDDQHFHYGYHNPAEPSSPTCFNISLAADPMHSSWSSGAGQVDDCSLLLPSHD